MWEGKNSSDAGPGMQVWRYLLLVDTTAKYVYIWDRDDDADDKEDQYEGEDNNSNQINHIRSMWEEKNNWRPPSGMEVRCYLLLLDTTAKYVYIFGYVMTAWCPVVFNLYMILLTN